MMKDSKLPFDWVQRQIAANPMVVLANGNIRTCPVRLSFVNLVTPKKNDQGKDMFGTGMLFPPGVEGLQGDFGDANSILWPIWYREAMQKFPKNFDQNRMPFGLVYPVHRCDTKQQYMGYTPGCTYLDSSSNFKPAVVDTAGNPIVDTARIYSGAWAICALNPYFYDNKKKGIGFGLQSVMIIADDTSLMAGAGDPQRDFQGVQVDNSYSPVGQFGQQAPPAPPQQSIMPPGQPVYHQPGSTSVAPPQGYGAPPPPDYAPQRYAPPMQGQGAALPPAPQYQPPAPPQSVMPPQQAYAPPPPPQGYAPPPPPPGYPGPGYTP